MADIIGVGLQIGREGDLRVLRAAIEDLARLANRADVATGATQRLANANREAARLSAAFAQRQHDLGTAVQRISLHTREASLAMDGGRLAVGRLTNSFGGLAASLGGIPGPLGNIAANLSQFAIGGGVTLAAVAGIAGLVAIFRLFNEEARVTAERLKEAAQAAAEFGTSELGTATVQRSDIQNQQRTLRGDASTTGDIKTLTGAQALAAKFPTATNRQRVTDIEAEIARLGRLVGNLTAKIDELNFEANQFAKISADAATVGARLFRELKLAPFDAMQMIQQGRDPYAPILPGRESPSRGGLSAGADARAAARGALERLPGQVRSRVERNRVNTETLRTNFAEEMSQENQKLAQAASIGIAAIGGLAQAIASGGNVFQAAAQAIGSAAAQIANVTGNPIAGALIGLGSSLLGLFGGRKEPQRVIISDVEPKAKALLVLPPPKIDIQVVSPTGQSLDQLAYQIQRRERLDGSRRLPRGGAAALSAA